MKMMISAAMIVGLMAGCAPESQGHTETASLIAMWDRFDRECRGGSGDDPSTLRSCASRDTLDDQISAKGFCYGENATYGYEMRWDICNRMR